MNVKEKLNRVGTRTNRGKIHAHFVPVRRDRMPRLQESAARFRLLRIFTPDAGFHVALDKGGGPFVCGLAVDEVSPYGRVNRPYVARWDEVPMG